MATANSIKVGTNIRKDSLLDFEGKVVIAPEKKIICLELRLTSFGDKDNRIFVQVQRDGGDIFDFEIYEIKSFSDKFILSLTASKLIPN